MLRTLDRPVSASVKRSSSDGDLHIFSRAVSLLKETEEIKKQRPCNAQPLPYCAGFSKRIISYF